MSYTRTYTHTVEGGASAINVHTADSTNLDASVNASGTFKTTTLGIINQVTGLKCHLQVDVVRQGAAAVHGNNINNAALAELIRSAASEEERNTQDGDSNVKSVYIRVEFNN